MSMASICATIEADAKCRVMHETFGHLAVEPGSKPFPGSFLFIYGEYGDFPCIESNFPGVEDSPWFFDAMNEYIWGKIKDKGPASEKGRVYRFTGTYRMFKNGVSRFSGKVKKIKKGYLK